MIKTYSSLMLLALTLSMANMAHAQEIFSWKQGNATTYSDTPRHLIIDNVSTVDVQTNNISTPTQSTEPHDASAPATTNQDSKAKQIEAANKAIAEKNKKIEEDNKKRRAAACKTARLNLQTIKSTRVKNYDAALKRYTQDAQEFCH